MGCELVAVFLFAYSATHLLNNCFAHGRLRDNRNCTNRSASTNEKFSTRRSGDWGCKWICFCAHVDTAPDCPGANVKPIVHRNYQGQDLILPDDPSQVIRMSDYPYLAEKLGEDIITASGNTLLGADDKAGVTIIMELARHLLTHPEIPHGKIRILFTPDEEVGRGVEHLDMNKLGADYGYTLDGGPLGEVEDETFSADAMTFTFTGVSAHPGYAKGKMQHAIKMASDFVSALPSDRWSPETTSHREGFVHPTSISGSLESATVSFILRDHITAKLTEYADQLVAIANEVLSNYPGARMAHERVEQYRNMKEILTDCPFVTDYAVEAMEKAGITPKRSIIRGGTDGSRLSFMGLPCPNIFAGGHNFHGRYEYVPLESILSATEVICKIAELTQKRYL